MAKAKVKKPAPKSKPAAKKPAPAKKTAPVKKSAPAKKPPPPAKQAPAKKVTPAKKAPAPVAVAKPKTTNTAPVPQKKSTAPAKPVKASAQTSSVIQAPSAANAPKLTPVAKQVKPLPIPSEVLKLKDKPAASNDSSTAQEKREIHQSDIFSEDELRMFLDALKKERASLLEKARAAVDAGNIALDKDEMYDEVDLASATVDQNLTFRLLDRDRKLLNEIDHAIQKIQTGEFGYCEGTGEPIPKRRLELRPWCRHSVKYKEQLERLEKSGRGVVDEDAELLD
jgi:DnaK suppressor protein